MLLSNRANTSLRAASLALSSLVGSFCIASIIGLSLEISLCIALAPLSSSSAFCSREFRPFCCRYVHSALRAASSVSFARGLSLLMFFSCRLKSAKSSSNVRRNDARIINPSRGSAYRPTVSWFVSFPRSTVVRSRPAQKFISITYCSILKHQLTSTSGLESNHASLPSGEESDSCSSSSSTTMSVPWLHCSR